MRLTTLLAVILLTGFVLFLAGWFRPQTKPAAALPPVPATHPAMATPLEEAATVNVSAPGLDASAPSALSASAGTNPPDAQTAENRIAELETLAMNDDTNSLNLILVALSDTNPDIREAALESTIQFGSLDAIPTLQHVMAKSAVPEEKVKIQEAIDFLQLSPLATNEAKLP